MSKPTLTIISAMYPHRRADDFTEIFMKVWFEEIDEPLPFMATLFDREGHGRELWFRAMKGEYGPIEILPDSPQDWVLPPVSTPTPKLIDITPLKVLTHDHG